MWKFKNLQEDSVLTDPVESSFFANNDDSDNLIREAIQNSLDAQVDSDVPVSIKISFSDTEHNVTGESKNLYLKGIKKHLEAIGEEEDFNPEIIRKPMSYVVVEDFNTRGLQGDPDYFGLITNETKENRNDFYWFYRNRGRSGKAGEQRGRWGLGKRVFPQCSAINAFIGYTLRKKDRKKLIMGQCVLKTHQINNRVYDNTGFFSDYGNKPMPFDDEDMVSGLCEDFQLKRKDEAGFSVIIPYPNEHVNFDNITRACIRHFFYPILSGDLIIELYRGGSPVPLDRTSLTERLREISWDGDEEKHLEKMIDFTLWSLSLKPEEIIRLNKAGDNSAPQWSNSLFEIDTDWNSVGEKFRDQERLAFRIPFYIKKKNQSQILTHFDVFIEQDRKISDTKECFIREGLNINAIRTVKMSYIRGMVVINHKPLSTLLGDAEDPAHKDWKEKQDKLKNNYDRPASSVRFVKNSLTRILDYLSISSAVPDKDLIADVEGLTFSVIDPIEPEKEKKRRVRKKKGKGDSSDKPEVEVVGSRKKYVLNKTIDGFRIKHSEEYTGEPFTIMVSCAYSTPVGDPFKNYEKFDFIMDNPPKGTVYIENEGAIIESVEGKTNTLRIRITDKEFKVSVDGFDTKRDLEIKTRAGVDKVEA